MIRASTATLSSNGPVDSRLIAKDGADFPSAEVRSSKAQLTVTVAETYDVEFVSPTPQELQFDLLLPAQKIHRTQTLVFNPATQGKPASE
jgi:hypothetical protein